MTSLDPLNFPIVLTPEGVTPIPPANLRSTLNQIILTGNDPISGAPIQPANPGFTANLPGGLIEDILSTDTGALALIDLARVETINSLTPFGCNAFVLRQMGILFGVIPSQSTNPTVVVVFTGTVRYIIPSGFQISDGNHIYVILTPGVIGTGGSSLPMTAVATSQGTWAIPPNTVTSFVTSVPSGITLAVTNPLAGLSGTTAETEQEFRLRVFGAMRAAAQGTPDFVKSLIQNIPGVIFRLVAIQQASGTNWRILISDDGVDPVQVAGAIYQGMSNVSQLVGSAEDSGRNVTVAINSYPDIYNITYVKLLSQIVSVSLTWKTTASFAPAAVFGQEATTAIVNAINNIPATAPINLLALNDAVQQAVAASLPLVSISSLAWIIEINSVVTPPTAGTSLVVGDPEGYFITNMSNITVVQG